MKTGDDVEIRMHEPKERTVYVIELLKTTRGMYVQHIKKLYPNRLIKSYIIGVLPLLTKPYQ